MNPASVSDTIVQEITINGSANRIFDALTDPDQRVDDARPHRSGPGDVN